ncbi:tetraspanin-17-like [Anabas testudineus]|uniref:tetraspanin-17-like n=1 Tax=Anabas testudineus TaxID=64144 RepID=UPI000E465E8B|nr:tetraspanin-17-like [Anabas testudineus]
MVQCECGIIFKYILIHLCMIFEVMGSVFLGFGLWWKVNAEAPKNNDLFATVQWILIIQGALMMIIGVCGIYGVCKDKTFGLKMLSVLLAVLALVDIVLGMVVHFNCSQNCPELPEAPSNKASDKVMGVFLSTAALL